MSTYLYPVAAILGASQTGLAGTITFLVRSTDGTTRLSARPTGVVEVGTGTGTYSVGDVAFDTAWGNLEILWQVSGALVGYEAVVPPVSSGGGDVSITEADYSIGD